MTRCPPQANFGRLLVLWSPPQDMAEFLAAATVSTASLSIVGPLLDWLRSSDLATEAAKSVATGPLGNWSHQLAELARKSGWGVVVERLSVGSLPPNHDVAHASRRALTASLLWMAHEIDGQVPTEVRAHLLRSIDRGTPPKDLPAWPPGEGRLPWVKGLMRLARDDEAVQTLERLSLSDGDVRDLIRTHTDAQRAQAFHKRVRQWLELHVPHQPPELDDFLGRGWSLPGLEGRLSLYQAWCVFFREQVKREPKVFNSFVATALADLLAGAERPLSLGQQDFASAFSDHLDGPLQELLLLTRKTHDTVGRLAQAAHDTTTVLHDIKADVQKLPEAIVDAVIAALQVKREAEGADALEGPMLLALAHRLKIEDVQTPAQALSALERLVMLAQAVILRGSASNGTSSLVDSTLGRVAELTATGQVDEGRLAIERALEQLASEQSRQAERFLAERRTLLDAAIEQEKVARDVDRTVAAILQRIALDEMAPEQSSHFDEIRAAHLDSGMSDLVVFDLQVALAMSRLRLVAADSEAAREHELQWVATCLEALGQLSTGLTVLPFAARILDAAQDAADTRHQGGDFVAHLTAAFEEAKAEQARLKDWTRHHAQQAVAAYRELLQSPSQSVVSMKQIWVRRSLGNALDKLAEFETGTSLLEESSALYLGCLNDLRNLPSLDDDEAERSERKRMHKMLYGEMRATGQFLRERQRSPTCEPSRYWSDEW